MHAPRRARVLHMSACRSRGVLSCTPRTDPGPMLGAAPPNPAFGAREGDSQPGVRRAARRAPPRRLVHCTLCAVASSRLVASLAYAARMMSLSSGVRRDAPHATAMFRGGCGGAGLCCHPMSPMMPPPRGPYRHALTMRPPPKARPFSFLTYLASWLVSPPRWREASLPVAVLPVFGPALGCFCACARDAMSFGGVVPWRSVRRKASLC